LIIAGIGSRETPKDILSEMESLGVWCAINKIWIRSGHAEGADYAFETGAQEFCITYEPWRNFNDGKLKRTRAKVCIPPDQKWMDELVQQFHPAPDKLSAGARKLMARNGCQLFGSDIEKHHLWSKAVVCWTSDGKASGGTGQAIRIANQYKIPVMNMYWPQFSTADKVIARLKEIQSVPSTI
jgi:hypothetical protein